MNVREYAIDYLIKSNFVTALVKKSIFPSDIDNYYEDYKGETWVAILGLEDKVWDKLYRASIEKDTDYEYQIRNYISRLILNVCHSNTSNAYRLLKKHSLREYTKNDVQWVVYKNTVEEPKAITEQILDLDEQERVEGT